MASSSFSFMDQRAFFFTLHGALIKSFFLREFIGPFRLVRSNRLMILFFVDQRELFTRRKRSDTFLHELVNLFNVGAYRFVDFFVGWWARGVGNLKCN